MALDSLSPSTRRKTCIIRSARSRGVDPVDPAGRGSEMVVEDGTCPMPFGPGSFRRAEMIGGFASRGHQTNRFRRKMAMAMIDGGSLPKSTGSEASMGRAARTKASATRSSTVNKLFWR